MCSLPVRQLLPTFALAPRNEGRLLIPGVSSAPAHLYLPCQRNSKPAVLDMTVSSPLQKLTFQEPSSCQGCTLSVEDKRKWTSQQNACQASRIEFVPLVVETNQTVTHEALETIKLIGHLKGQRIGVTLSETAEHLFQRIGIELCERNACMRAVLFPVTAH